MGRRGDELDGRADLYSLGVVLYEMVTGRLPFESDTAMGIILHHLQTLPTPAARAAPRPRDPRAALRGAPAGAGEGPRPAVPDRGRDDGRPRRRPRAALPERAGGPGPPRPAATPRPVPTDIDRHETRVMPKTPTAGSTHVAPATVHLPPLPGAPVPTPPRTGTPPPLPVFTDPQGLRKTKGRWRWWKWGLAGLAFYGLCGRPSDLEEGGEAGEPGGGGGRSPAADPEAKEQDEELKEQVEGLLDDSPVTDDESIYVHVHDSVVTLTGHVHDRKPALEADRIVRAAPGVVNLINEIELRAANDHRSTVPRAEAVLAVPPPGRRAGPGAAAPVPPRHAAGPRAAAGADGEAHPGGAAGESGPAPSRGRRAGGGAGGVHRRGADRPRQSRGGGRRARGGSAARPQDERAQAERQRERARRGAPAPAPRPRPRTRPRL